MNKRNQAKKLVGIFLFVIGLGTVSIYLGHFDWFAVFSFAWLIFLGHLMVGNQIEFGRGILEQLKANNEEDDL